MKVIELQERLRYEVVSTTTAGENRLVDMAEGKGNGFCSCWVFTKIKPALEEYNKNWKGKPGTYVPQEAFQCIHIKAVNAFLANRLVQHIRAEFPDHNQGT